MAKPPQAAERIREGHFARKQIFCKDWLIAWSHRSRFEVGLRLARDFAGGRVLDYGSGDGTFLAMLMSGEAPPSAAVGVELDPAVVADCNARFDGVPNLSFIRDEELRAPEHRGAYDALVCMEVLEHVVDVDTMLDRFVELLKPSGRLLVSVPSETGLPLLVKQAVRTVAGWRGIGDYPGTSPYTAREYAAGLFAGSRQHIERPVFRHRDGFAFHDHKGFNWRVIREQIAERFEVQETLGSPLTWLTPHLASQVWFLARRRP